MIADMIASRKQEIVAKTPDSGKNKLNLLNTSPREPARFPDSGTNSSNLGMLCGSIIGGFIFFRTVSCVCLGHVDTN